jgi:UMF1 family MFS transporter
MMLNLVGTVASRYLRPTISSLEADHSQSIKSRPEPLVTYKERKEEIIRSVKLSWVGLGKTLKEWRRLPMTFVFLSAWFLLSDSEPRTAIFPAAMNAEG